LRRCRSKQTNSERTSTNIRVKERRWQKRKKEIFEIKKTTQDMKEELNEDMENLRKKNRIEILEIKGPFKQIKNTVEGYSSRLNKWKTESKGLKKK
jgi:chromosome segregation ATPase